VTHIREPNAKGVISACYNKSTGKIRMVNRSAHCVAREKKLTWQQRVPKPTVHVVGSSRQPAYASGWKAYNGPPFGNLSFFKDASGVVHLTGLACRVDDQNSGLCAVATLIGGTLPVFTLPAGFRPASQQLFTAISVGQSKNYYNPRIDVTTAGVVEVVAPPNAGEDWVSFDGISFIAR
jgi:hypothetical protein